MTESEELQKKKFVDNGWGVKVCVTNTKDKVIVQNVYTEGTFTKPVWADANGVQYIINRYRLCPVQKIAEEGRLVEYVNG